MNTKKLFVSVICLAPMLMSYKFFVPGVSIAEALMLISLLLHALSQKSLWFSQKLALLVLLFVVLLMHLLYASSTGVAGHLGYFRLAKYFILLLFIAVAYQDIDYSFLIKVLVICLVVNFFGILYQSFIYLTTGRGIPLLVPFLPLVNAEISLESIAKVLDSNFRPGGFFMEPAHLSYYSFFSGLFLYKSDFKHKNIMLILICILLFSTFSSFGLLASVCIFALIFLQFSLYLKITGFLIVSILMLFFLSSIEEFVTLLPQVSRLIDPDSVSVTGRLFTGEHLTDQLDPHQKLWGLGFGNFELNGFLNMITYLRISFGDAGIIILSCTVAAFSIKNHNNFLYISLLVGMAFFTSMLLTPFLLMATLPFIGARALEEN